MTQTAEAHRIEPLHEVQDEGKLATLIGSMQEYGWIGAEIVVIEREDADPQAITGSHRIAAAREVGIDVPTVNLTDLLAEHGASLSGLVADFEAAGLSLEDATREVVMRLDDHLPADACGHYGLDAH